MGGEGVGAGETESFSRLGNSHPSRNIRPPFAMADAPMIAMQMAAVVYAGHFLGMGGVGMGSDLNLAVYHNRPSKL